MRAITKPSTRFYLVLDNQEISWAPMFDSREEADQWLLERDDHEMLGAKIHEYEVDECAEEGCTWWTEVNHWMNSHHPSPDCLKSSDVHCSCPRCDGLPDYYAEDND